MPIGNVLGLTNNSKMNDIANQLPITGSSKNILNNGTNYSNWHTVGVSTTKGVNGIHLVRDDGSSQADIALPDVRPNIPYKITYTIKGKTALYPLAVDGNFTGVTYNLESSVGTHTVILSAKSDITDKRLIFYFSSGDGLYYDFTLDNVEIAYPYANTTPTVIFTFDDGYVDVFTKAYPIMQPLGIKGTVYLNGGFVGNGNILSHTQLHELHDIAGWCISSHTMVGTELSTLTADEAKPIIQEEMQWLYDNGYYNGVYHFAYHGIGSDQTEKHKMLKGIGMKTVRCGQYPAVNGTSACLYSLEMKNCSGGALTVAQMKTEITNAMAANKTVIIMFHHVVETAGEVGTDGMHILKSDFQDLCTWLSTNSISTKTIDEWYNSLTTIHK